LQVEELEQLDTAAAVAQVVYYIWKIKLLQQEPIQQQLAEEDLV
jgi:hypothetical protein